MGNEQAMCRVAVFVNMFLLTTAFSHTDYRSILATVCAACRLNPTMGMGVAMKACRRDFSLPTPPSSRTGATSFDFPHTVYRNAIAVERP